MSNRDIDGLIERVEALTGPSREVDAAVASAFGLHAWAGRLSAPNGDGSWADIGPSTVTSSIDAVLALIGNVVPAALWQVKRGFQYEGVVWFLETDYDDHPVPTGYASTPALALLLALLRAIRARRSE